MKEINELANECYGCINKPCQSGCPLNNDTTGFIKLIKIEKFKEAYELLCNTTVLQPICGRICPHSKQCQGSCIRRFKADSVEIGKLEAYIGDLAIKNGWKIPKNVEEKKKEKIAIIGGGPCGLTCAAFLAKEGYNVTIFERKDKLGGIIEHGIPEFRLDPKTIDDTINKILELGINIETKKELGKNLSLEYLKENFDAIFLSFGANISSKMNIQGEEKDGVYGGNELLENKDFPDFKDKKVAVIGGGNVAMDTARTIKRLGAKDVNVIYRRSEKEMPAEGKEIEDAKKENINFLFQTNILKILGKNKVEKIECIKTKLIQKEGETRLSPVNIENSNFILDMDYVIMAVGSKVEEKLINTLDLDTTNYGNIKIDEDNKTSDKMIFAGGDLVGTRSTIAWAAKSGRDAAKSIIKYLQNK